MSNRNTSTGAPFITSRPYASRSAQGRCGGFTLIELLIVIGIILLLISIIIPAIASVRRAVQNVATRQVMGRIEAGITAYYADFGAYPGPFGNRQLVGSVQPDLPAGTNPNPPVLDFGGTAVALKFVTGLGPDNALNTADDITTAGAFVTSTENLYLGLVGGLSYGTVPANVFSAAAFPEFNPTGPGNLNLAALKKHPSYLEVKRNETTLAGEFTKTGTAGQWNAANGGFSGDTIIPEILDAYPAPSPIIFLRANKGAANALNTGTAYDNTAQYQTSEWTTAYNGSADDPSMAMSTFTTDYPAKPLASGSLSAGQQSYLCNPDLSPNAGAITPYKRDSYVLISAGPDGKFGTKDDITNFR